MYDFHWLVKPHLLGGVFLLSLYFINQLNFLNMQKFLSIPVTLENDQLVSCVDIKLMEQASNTTVTIAYGSGKIVTITHATTPTRRMLLKLQEEVVLALQQPWRDVVKPVSNLPFAVSGIAIL